MHCDTDDGFIVIILINIKKGMKIKAVLIIIGKHFDKYEPLL